MIETCKGFWEKSGRCGPLRRREPWTAMRTRAMLPRVKEEKSREVFTVFHQEGLVTLERTI